MTNEEIKKEILKRYEECLHDIVLFSDTKSDSKTMKEINKYQRMRASAQSTALFALGCAIFGDEMFNYGEEQLWWISKNFMTAVGTQ